MAGFRILRKNGPVRRTLPALVVSGAGILAMLGAIFIQHSAGLLPYFFPAATVLLNLFLVGAIHLLEGDSDAEVFVVGIFLAACISLAGGLIWMLVALRLSWWIYAIIIVVFGVGLFLLYSGALQKKYRGGPHYFSTFGIILVPMNLSQPISPAEAAAREKDGRVYYIGHYNDAGKLLTAEKRRNGKTDYKYTYVYEGKKIVEYTLEKAAFEDGKPAHFKKTPDGSWTRAEN